MSLSADCCKFHFVTETLDRRQAWSHKFGPKYYRKCSGDDSGFHDKVKSTLPRRGGEIGYVVATNFGIAKVDLKLCSLCKALTQASLVISLNTGCAKIDSPQTSTGTTHAHLLIRIQNHVRNVIARIFPIMTSLVSVTPSPWELPQWSVAAPTHPSAMSTTLVP